MVDKLEVGKTYRLVDEEGFIEKNHCNNGLLEKHFKRNLVTLDKVLLEEGWVGKDVVITREEFLFFELVEDIITPNLWDGESELQVGMLVKEQGGMDFLEEVLLIEGTQVVLKNNKGLISTSNKKCLLKATEDPRKVFSQHMLRQVRNSHLDFAQDITWDIVDLSNRCYDEFECGKLELATKMVDVLQKLPMDTLTIRQYDEIIDTIKDFRLGGY